MLINSENSSPAIGLLEGVNIYMIRAIDDNLIYV